MSLLTIAKAVAVNVNIPVPTTAIGTDTDSLRLVQSTQEAADEIARRVDWSALRSTTTITGTGTNDDFSLPSGFARLTGGMAVTVGGVPVRGSVSQDEWLSLTAVSGTPRYFRLSGSTVSFYPYPTIGTEVVVSYQSENWCSAGGKVWTVDADTALIPEELIIKGALWRWRRQLGANFQDYLAEFESTLAELAKAENRVRSP